MTGWKLGRLVASVMACALLASGCAGMDPEARKLLQQSASCEEPTAQIETLQGSRAGAGLRVAQGLQGILPPMIVLSVLRDIFWGQPYRSIYLDHWRVAFGSYNRKIDARVAKLEGCGG